MKRTTKTFCLILALITTLTFLGSYNFIVHAEGSIQEEQLGDIATLQSDYADDRVLVVLDNETSLLFNEYTPAYFSNINCKSVTNITQPITSIAKAQAENTAAINTEILIDVNKYEQILCLELEEGGKERVAEAIKLLLAMDGVKYAGPDYLLTRDSTTSNDQYSQIWDIDAKLQLPQAWDITTGSNSIMVGVIDSGIDGTHPDLSPNINYSLCRDFTSDSAVVDPSPTDNDGHGTAVASIIGAKGNNSQGMSGVCWNVQLVSLKVKNTESNIYSSRVILAINYATSANIPILCMSLSWSSAKNNLSFYDEPLYTAISNYPGLLVCSAGNQTADNDAITTYPSGYDLPNIICVGASNTLDNKVSQSNYGASTVDIFAPGITILTCCPIASCSNNTHDTVYSTHYAHGYHIQDGGTSFAAPYVAGVAALLLSRYPNLTPIQIKQAIIENDDNCSALTGLCVSGGRLNAYKVLTGHIHYYTYSYTPAGSKHRSYCSCGAYIEESHTYVQSGTVATCTKCNHQVMLQSIDPELETE